MSFTLPCGNFIGQADTTIQINADKNHFLSFLRNFDNTIDWKPVEKPLIKFHETGKAKEGIPKSGQNGRK
jgi:hypothetical protein